MKIVGLLCGREYSFPPAFIARVNQLGAKDGVAAEFVKLAGTKMGEVARYKVIVDRISHEVEYYRGYLKHAALEGTYVINAAKPGLVGTPTVVHVAAGKTVTADLSLK